MNEAIDILKGYGVDTFWYGFDSQKMYFRVKKRQARWAEYVLLHAGVELLNPAFDHRNAGLCSQSHAGLDAQAVERRTVRQDRNVPLRTKKSENQ